MEANDNNSRKVDANLKRIRDALMDGSKNTPLKKRNIKHTTSSISVSGDMNIIGDGNNINYNSSPSITVVKVQTGVGVLTAAQKAKMNTLIKEWVEARGSVRRSKAEIAALRSAFNRAMNVNSYAEILQEDFERAMTWLRRQTGIINSMPSAPKKNPNWRNTRYRAINARAKEFQDGEIRFRRYAEERYGSGSLKELSDEQLDAVYRYVFSWRHR